MGSCLPKPVESTIIERQTGESFKVGIAEINGWRNNMEDAHLIFMRSDWGIFGVFDGHGGDACSKFVAPRMHALLEEEGCPPDEEAVKNLFFRVDEEFLDTKQCSGSTATMCIVHPPAVAGGKYKLLVINAGDSRVMLGRANGDIVSGGDNCTDQGLTVDHKPCHPVERERIYRCGGHVEMAAGGVARVNGDLAVSRGFGDADYKKTGGPGPEDRPVTCNPEIAQYECDATDFLMLVCDGVSEGNFPNPEVVQLAAQKLNETNDPGLASKAVIHKALEMNSKDNITCMIVTFGGGELSSGMEFIPGPMSAVENSGFLTAYKAMAERAGKTLGEAVEMRYNTIEQELTSPDLTEAQVEELNDERKAILGNCTATNGSEELKAHFENWKGASRAAGGGQLDQLNDQEAVLQMLQAGGGAALMSLIQGQQGQDA